MRILLFLAVVAFARGASLTQRTVPWDEWDEDLHLGGPGDSPTKPPSVCTVPTEDGGVIEVCCEGYTGRVEDGCQTPICSSPCLNGGSCAAPNRCICTKAYTGEDCSELNRKDYRWSSWVPMGSSAFLFVIKETLSMCKNTVPEAMECQTESGVDHTMRGQVMTCDRRRGLECLNDEQPGDDSCDSYQVRLLCPVDDSKKSTLTCLRKRAEYNSGEVVKDGDCIACECLYDGRWNCHRDEDYCDTPISTTPAPAFTWLPAGVYSGQCMVGETVFSPGETTILDCRTCTCDITRGWQCIDIEDPTCTAPPEDDYCRIENHFIFFHGQTAKKDCNTCICKNREWDCTKTICPDKNRRVAYFSQCVHPETNERHEDGEIVKRDCNVCVCTQGKWECTRDECREGTHDDSDSSLARRKVCTTPTGLPFPHGATISQDCNACKCFDGKWQCTRRFCSPETYPNSTCLDEVTASLVRSGKTIRRGCDVCLCNGGNLTCTSKPCQTNTGACFDEQRRFTTTSTAFDKQYRPVCHPDGTFQPIQCNPLHSVCFCVTPMGQVIPHTAVKMGVATPNCLPFTASHYNPLHYTMPISETPLANYPCIKRNADTTSRLTGYFTPQCLSNGYFAPLQCDPHTGVCYCVSPEGTTIPGTIMHVSKGRPNCRVLREETPTSVPEQQTPCQQERSKAEQYKLPFKPACNDFGEYMPFQFNPHTKVDFCVDRSGMVLEETIKKTSEHGCDRYANYYNQEVKPHTARVDTRRRPFIWNTFPVKDLIHNTPRCDLQRKISEQVPTVYQPSCETDGRYRPMQCPNTTHVCFCVDVTGAIIPHTTRRRELTQPDCNEYRSVFDVVTPSNSSTIMVHPPVSLFHTGWDPTLTEIDHDNHRVGPQRTRTLEPVIFKTNVTACIRQQQIASVVPGVFRPSCQRNGTFTTMQHEPLTHDVYCVDKNGVKIEGTERRMDYQILPECNKYWNTTIDMQKVSKHWSSEESQNPMETLPLDSLFPAGLHHDPNCTRQQELTSRLEGAVVPTCEPNGTYTPLQCNATTGVCYCMLPYGDIIPDTVMPMVKGAPSCWHLKDVSILEASTPIAKVCKMPVVTGPCRARFIRWAFSKLLNKCTLFVYGGCAGNLNRFETKDECEKTCGSLTPPRHTRPLTCERKLARFNRLSFTKRINMRRPSCSPDGNHNTKQCALSRTEEGRIEKVCECVDTVTGERLERCPEEEVVSLRPGSEEHSVEPTPPSPTPAIDGCRSEGVLYHEGDEFFKECNECMCIGNNQATCTKNYCHQERCYHNGMSAESYERGCEECSCIGGQWDCQRKPNCDPDDSHSGSGTATECHTEDGGVMNVGTFYYNKCNKCTCDRDGHVHCENNYCPTRHCYHIGLSYHERDTVMQDCNKCICFSGHWDCQNYTCDPYMKSRVRLEGCEYKEETYNNGDTFHDKCNSCQCLGNNITTCHKDVCNPSSCFVKGIEIRSSQTKRVDCNTCTCYNGQLDCTKNTCSGATVQAMGRPLVSPDTSITCKFEGNGYINGQRFWKDCNPCRCFDDGEVRCEEEFCVENLCYEGGVGFRSDEVLFTETRKCTCYNGGVWNCVNKPEGSGPPDYIECPPSRPTISCSFNPCDDTICLRHPDATCRVDNCSQCQPVFFDIHGNRLRC